MFSNEKNESSLPDLPPLEDEFDRRMRNIRREKNNLPAFPDSSSHNKFSETAIKDAVEEDKLEEAPSTIEMEEWHSEERGMEEKGFPEIAEPILPKTSNDIFVKIDKFRTARTTLNDAKDKLEEIHSLINKIRDVKMREEQELTAWEKEISTAKARIHEVSSSIFDKVD